MEAMNIKRLALVLSVQAEIVGMKYENEARKQAQESMAYSGNDFQEKSHELENLAYCHDDQL